MGPRRGEGRLWDLGARRYFFAPRLKILMPGAKSRRQALRTLTRRCAPDLAPPGEGVQAPNLKNRQSLNVGDGNPLT